MIQIKATVDMAAESPRRRSLGLRLFKSKTDRSRQSSIDSTASSDVSPAGSKRSSLDGGRKLRKASLSLFASRQPASISEMESKAPPPSAAIRTTELPKRNKLQRRPTNDFPTVSLAGEYKRDEQTGEQQIDHTDLLHSLVHQESSDTVPRLRNFRSGHDSTALAGDVFLAQLPSKVWSMILDHLTLDEQASLYFTCKAFHAQPQLGQVPRLLNHAPNAGSKTTFLQRLDDSLPGHLLCYNCNTYHVRLQPRKESLKPTNVANPIFTCPHSNNPERRVSRVRITSNRTLPFTFVQLALRSHHFSDDHGISLDTLARRYKDRSPDETIEWSHQTRYAIVNAHLLVRVISTVFSPANLPPSGQRKLLYNPADEFHPFFSTCPHWRDGLLMPLVKCALSHIPAPIAGGGGGVDGLSRTMKARIQNTTHAHLAPVALCGDCRPIRRCPRCPTEYLMEVKISEDRSEPDPTRRFKQSLVLTRWSDLGDGSAPSAASSPEWAACAGMRSGDDEAGEDFDSFAKLGRRAVSGIFEAQFNVDLIPGQRVLNMNPNKDERGEAGHDWY